jgi:hypothetical protein
VGDIGGRFEGGERSGSRSLYEEPPLKGSGADDGSSVSESVG